MRTTTEIFAVAVILLSLVIQPSLRTSAAPATYCALVQTGAGATGSSPQQPYHNQPPSAPLPKTLDPSQFSADPTTYVAYSVAREVPEILYQVPCACPCGLREHHQSLYDCFRTEHGHDCDACKKEAVFCFEAQKKGMTVLAIREAIQGFQWTKINLEEYAKNYLSDHKATPAQ